MKSRINYWVIGSLIILLSTVVATLLVPTVSPSNLSPSLHSNASSTIEDFAWFNTGNQPRRRISVRTHQAQLDSNNQIMLTQPRIENAYGGLLESKSGVLNLNRKTLNMLGTVRARFEGGRFQAFTLYMDLNSRTIDLQGEVQGHLDNMFFSTDQASFNMLTRHVSLKGNVLTRVVASPEEPLL